MKIGDFVNLTGSHSGYLAGTIIGRWDIDDWWVVFTNAGEIINWPESQMELINESR